MAAVTAVLHRGFGDSLKIYRLADSVSVTLDLLNRKSIAFDITVLRTISYCAKFQVIPIRVFRFIVLTYTPTHIHTHTHRDKMIAISAPLYKVVGADKHNMFVAMNCRN